jgi:hypothetical protein
MIVSLVICNEEALNQVALSLLTAAIQQNTITTDPSLERDQYIIEVIKDEAAKQLGEYSHTLQNNPDDLIEADHWSAIRLTRLIGMLFA